MNFSIILASRERLELLSSLIDSIHNNTKDIEKVEVLVGIDNDDSISQKAALHLPKTYPFSHFFSRNRSSNLNNDYLNWISGSYAKGKYFIICNDDSRFQTKNWDEIIINKLENYLSDKPDRIAYGFMSDSLLNRHGMGYCCFPLITKEAFDALGFSMPPEYNSWNADIALWQIYSSINRICDLSEVTIDHISYHAGKRDPDHINNHVRSISNGVQSVDAYVQRIKKVIERKK